MKTNGVVAGKTLAIKTQQDGSQLQNREYYVSKTTQGPKVPRHDKNNH